MVAFVLVLASCTPQEPRFTPRVDPAVEMGLEDPGVDSKKAKALVEKAVAALRDGDLGLAREALGAAERFADELRREEIRQVRQSIDSAEADKYAPGINELAADGKCDEALDTAVEVIEGKSTTAIPAFVKKRTSGKLLECLLGQLEADLSIGRRQAESDRVATALTTNTLQQFQRKVTDATVQALIGRFSEPIDNRRWADAKALLDELVERNEAGDREYNRIMALIRKGIAEEVAAKVSDGLDSKTGVSSKLEAVDQLIEVAEWGTRAGSAVGGGGMPPTVKRHRDTLALWNVCTGFRCTMVSPKKNWAYGAVDLQPTLNPRGKKLETIKHATRVWRIAESSGWVLISRKKKLDDLRSVGSRVPIAAGWVKASGLRTSDTAEWLPPSKAVIGTRVWGPLRKGQQEFELGRVIDVRGSDVAVERMADRAIVTVSRGKVRFGTISPGTKILASCAHPIKLEPAVIERVKFPLKGDPIVHYRCAGGDKRNDQLGAVRAKSSELPGRR